VTEGQRMDKEVGSYRFRGPDQKNNETSSIWPAKSTSNAMQG